MSEDLSKLQLIGEISQANNKNLELIEELNKKEDEIKRLNNIIKQYDKVSFIHEMELQKRIDKVIEYKNQLLFDLNRQYITFEKWEEILEPFENILKGSDK